MFCKNCGAYIFSDSEPCEECGAINGVTQYMKARGDTEIKSSPVKQEKAADDGWVDPYEEKSSTVEKSEEQIKNEESRRLLLAQRKQEDEERRARIKAMQAEKERAAKEKEDRALKEQQLREERERKEREKAERLELKRLEKEHRAREAERKRQEEEKLKQIEAAKQEKERKEAEARAKAEAEAKARAEEEARIAAERKKQYEIVDNFDDGLVDWGATLGDSMFDLDEDILDIQEEGSKISEEIEDIYEDVSETVNDDIEDLIEETNTEANIEADNDKPTEEKSFVDLFDLDEEDPYSESVSASQANAPKPVNNEYDIDDYDLTETTIKQDEVKDNSINPGLTENVPIESVAETKPVVSNDIQNEVKPKYNDPFSDPFSNNYSSSISTGVMNDNNNNASVYQNQSNSQPIVSNVNDIDKLEDKTIQNNPESISSMDNVGKKGKSKSNGKKPPFALFVILLVIVIAALVGFKNKDTIINLVSGSKTTSTSTTFKYEEPSSVTESTTSGVEPSVASSVTSQIDSYSVADISFVTENIALQAATQSNGVECGKIKSINIEDTGKATIQTDKFEILFTIENSINYKEEEFSGKSVVVIGNKLYDSISATKVYVYEAKDVPSTTAATSAPANNTTSVSVPQTSVNTTKPSVTKSTARTTVEAVVVPEYITKTQADALMNEWRKDGSKLGSSNAYFGTIKTISSNGNNTCVQTAGYKIYFKGSFTDPNSVIGQNILAVAKNQSGQITASKVYIYKAQ